MIELTREQADEMFIALTQELQNIIQSSSPENVVSAQVLLGL